MAFRQMPVGIVKHPIVIAPPRPRVRPRLSKLRVSIGEPFGLSLRINVKVSFIAVPGKPFRIRHPLPQILRGPIVSHLIQ